MEVFYHIHHVIGWKGPSSSDLNTEVVFYHIRHVIVWKDLSSSVLNTEVVFYHMRHVTVWKGLNSLEYGSVLSYSSCYWVERSQQFSLEYGSSVLSCYWVERSKQFGLDTVILLQYK